MRILGVDPGTRFAGVGIVEVDGNKYRPIHYDVIKANAKLSIPKRLSIVYEGIKQVIAEYQPDVLALEDIFYGKDLRAMIHIGEARACAMLAASEQDIDVVEYPPTRVKQSVSGNGRASKEQMQQMVKTLLALKEVPPSDAADALAVAICHIHSRNQKDLSKLAKS